MKLQKGDGGREHKMMSVVENRDNFLISFFYVPEPGGKEVIKLKSLTFEIIGGKHFSI